MAKKAQKYSEMRAAVTLARELADKAKDSGTARARLDKFAGV